jgi:hypothetical protein
MVHVDWIPLAQDKYMGSCEHCNEYLVPQEMDFID